MSKAKYMTTKTIRMSKGLKEETESLKHEYNISPTDYVKMGIFLLRNILKDEHVTPEMIIQLKNNAIDYDEFCAADAVVVSMSDNSNKTKKKACKAIETAKKIIKQDSRNLEVKK